MRDREPITEQDVVDANRNLYDAVAASYEDLDGRRSPQMRAWLSARLQYIRKMAPGGRLLDVGTGSGLVTRCAEGIFERRVGLDVSPQIIETNADAFDEGVVASVDNMPFADGSFDVVVAFAVLHHLYSFDALISEVSRILVPGGVFFVDHDMDAKFYGRVRRLFLVNSRAQGAGKKYFVWSAVVNPELYELSEWHRNGVDFDEVQDIMRKKDFSLRTETHWYGLSAVTDRIFGSRPFARGWGPLTAVWGTKT